MATEAVQPTPEAAPPVNGQLPLDLGMDDQAEAEFQKGWDSADEADKELEESQHQRAEKANREDEIAALADEPEPAEEAASEPEADKAEEPPEEEAAEAASEEPNDKGGSSSDPSEEPPAWAKSFMDRLEKLETHQSSPSAPAEPPGMEASTPATPPAAPPAPDIPAIPPEVEEKLKAFEKVEPEVGGALRASLEGMGERLRKVEGGFQQQQEQTERQAAEAALTEAHPDWRDLVKEGGFREWVEGETELVKAKVYSPNPGDAISVLDYYKKVSGYNAAESDAEPEKAGDGGDVKQAKMALRKAVSTPKAGRSASKPPPEDDFERAFNATKI